MAGYRFSMNIENIKTRAHTTADGILNLSCNVGLRDSDVAVTIQVRRLDPMTDADEDGWPRGYFAEVVGSMPDLKRAPQGEFEVRLPLE